MAEDVLRLAGFVEHVNYRKQAGVEGGPARPDYTFELPKGHVLYMDVKFPMAAYLRHLEAGTGAEREAHLRAFLRDVRARVRELAKREYARTGDRPSVDYVLLFLPNEQLTGFIHEHDPELLDEAMAQRVVMCSPLTLFAFLGVIRQAFDNFVIERTSDEILQLIGRFGQQWQKYTDSAEKVKKRLDSVQNEFDQLVGVRRRALERPLAQLEELRIRRNLPGRRRAVRRRARRRQRARAARIGPGSGSGQTPGKMSDVSQPAFDFGADDAPRRRAAGRRRQPDLHRLRAGRRDQPHVPAHVLRRRVGARRDPAVPGAAAATPTSRWPTTRRGRRRSCGSSSSPAPAPGCARC